MIYRIFTRRFAELLTVRCHEQSIVYVTLSRQASDERDGNLLFDKVAARYRRTKFSNARYGRSKVAYEVKSDRDCRRLDVQDPRGLLVYAPSIRSNDRHIAQSTTLSPIRTSHLCHRSRSNRKEFAKSYTCTRRTHVRCAIDRLPHRT